MQRLDVYKCEKCGNIVEVLNMGGGTLHCCGQPMGLLSENTTDAAQEKHVPVIEKSAEGIKVTVGSVAHPMEAEHFIQWIECIAGDAIQRQFLSPGQAPEACFPAFEGPVTAREYCNVHGHWKKDG